MGRGGGCLFHQYCLSTKKLFPLLGAILSPLSLHVLGLTEAEDVDSEIQGPEEPADARDRFLVPDDPNPEIGTHVASEAPNLSHCPPIPWVAPQMEMGGGQDALP